MAATLNPDGDQAKPGRAGAGAAAKVSGPVGKVSGPVGKISGPAARVPGAAAKAAGPAAKPAGPVAKPGGGTADRILDAALVSFGTRGYEVTSLDALAASLDVAKQTILYWFPSKEALLEALIDRSAGQLAEAMQSALDGAGDSWDRVEAVVRSVFRLAARRPELLGLVREVARLGPPAATQMTVALQPLVARASEFLRAEMAVGHMRQHDPHLLLLAIYSTVIGMVTEVEVLRALGEEPTARSLVRRRADVLALLRSALMTDQG